MTSDARQPSNTVYLCRDCGRDHQNGGEARLCDQGAYCTNEECRDAPAWLHWDGSYDLDGAKGYRGGDCPWG